MKYPMAAYDGYFALCFLATTPFAPELFGKFGSFLDMETRAYFSCFGGILSFALAIGFAISGIRYPRSRSRAVAIFTLILVLLIPLLFPAVNS